MAKGWRKTAAKFTGTNPKIDRKIFRLKRSWDEVSGILNSGPKKKRKRPR